MCVSLYLIKYYVKMFLHTAEIFHAEVHFSSIFHRVLIFDM